MSSAQSPHTNGIDRREFMRRSTIGAAGVVAIGAAGSTAYPEFLPVGRAKAVPPVAIGVGLAGAATVNWVMRETDPLGMDEPLDGLTESGLITQWNQAARTRKSTNASTFIDNKNIVENLDHAGHGDGKIAAIDAMNDDLSQSDVEDAAMSELNEYETTVKKNFLKSWNESVDEFTAFLHAYLEHEDVETEDMFEFELDTNGDGDSGEIQIDEDNLDVTETIELPNDEEFDIRVIEYGFRGCQDGVNSYCGSGDDGWYHVLDEEEGYWEGDSGDEVWVDRHAVIVLDEDAEQSFEYLDREEWYDLWQTIDDEFSSIRDGLLLWINDVYDEVETGELDTEDLLTPRELADMTADEEGTNQALVDLMALNIPVNPDREAEIYLPEIGATLYGVLAVTGEMEIEAGDEIDPAEEDHSFYLTYDVSQGHGEWSSFDEEIDEGELTFTDEPFEDTLYIVETIDGGTFEVTAADFDEDDDEWTADLYELEESTEVESIDYYAVESETSYETIQLTQEFHVETFRDADGEEHDSASFEPQSEPHSDDNYITEDEWHDMRDRFDELIEKYEESQNGGGTITIPGIGEIDAAEGLFGAIALAVIAIIISNLIG